mgnify:FL=1
MNDVQEKTQTEVPVTQEVTLENRLEIIEDGMRKKYLARLNDMQIAALPDLVPAEEDFVDNVRLYHITEMVYQKGESVTDKFTTIYNTLSIYRDSVFILMDSDGKKTDFYLGVRNNEENEAIKRSTVTLGDTLRSTLIGHFPGAKLHHEDRKKIVSLSDQILHQKNVVSVSVVGSNKIQDMQTNEKFVQGLEKLALAMQGRKYMGIILAENQSPQMIQQLRKNYQDLYTSLSSYQKIQFSSGDSKSVSKSKSFSEMDGKQKASMIAGAAVSLIGIGAGASLSPEPNAMLSWSMLGGQIAGQLNTFISALAPNEQISESTSTNTSTTTENKEVSELLQSIDDSLKRIDEFDSYGMWNIASYFLSDDMSSAEIAASNYRSLMNGDHSGRELSAINSWRSDDAQAADHFSDLTMYLSRFLHPRFIYVDSEINPVLTDATTSISGKELGLHMGLPRATVSGLPVIEHAEFAKEVVAYRLFDRDRVVRPEDRMMLGKVFDLGQITSKVVELENKSLNMHTFITGSTGSGKSNTVYQMLNELYQDKIPFLVIEPAKGEYKDVFGHFKDVNVYSTNPKIAELIHLNPFMFPDSIHVLEHVDGLVEIFNVCWPMYDAMSAFLKDAILRSYETLGWDLGASAFEGEEIRYPDFEILMEQLSELIDQSDYDAEVKSNYRGALITRIRSLTVGLNKMIFSEKQTAYEKLFDQNCILDISRVKSSETKALLMGLMVYILNEYRVDRKTQSNRGLNHVTVLEEAHHLLKNTSGTESDLIGKSVEMLTQTIAEIRTYGEGFIIVDQSPSSVDISAIKNTNTKIVLRTPEANDREAVGRSMGLTPDQVNEIAKLPSGVAAVYQNDWVNPVLTLINKADITEQLYVAPNIEIRTKKTARTMLIKMLLQSWFGLDRISEDSLYNSLNVLDLSRGVKKKLQEMITDYQLFAGNLKWEKERLGELQHLIQIILEIDEKKISMIRLPEELIAQVSTRIKGMNRKQLQVICYFLTYDGGDNND